MWRNLRVDVAKDDPVPLQLAKVLGQHLLRHLGDQPTERVGALRPVWTGKRMEAFHFPEMIEIVSSTGQVSSGASAVSFFIPRHQKLRTYA